MNKDISHGLPEKYLKTLFLKNERNRFPAAHLSFFSSFLSFFLASWLPAAACFESSSALAFFTLFSFPNCFLLVGIQSPRYAFGGFYLAFFLLKISLSYYLL